MLVSLILVFREVLEAGLIVGIVLAATSGVLSRGRWIVGGIAAGMAGAGLVASFAAALSDAFEGTGQEIFTACILGFAVAMLSWHVLWMSTHARSLAAEFRAVGQDVKMGRKSLAALAIVVAVAVLREGAEVVLFLYGLIAGSHTSGTEIAAGAATGLLLAGATSWLLYRGLVIIPVHRLFSVTNGLIALLAAGMAGQAVAVLHAADVLPGWGEQLWNTSAFLPDNSLLGKAMHALIGYSARPSGIQFAAWCATLAVLLLCSRLIGRPRPKSGAAIAMVLMLACGQQARADDSPLLTFHNHRFEPERMEVPAGKKFKLLIKNLDDTAEEFESSELNREKLVPPGQTVTVFLGPLNPGEYKIFGDFHQDTAKGVLVAK